MSLPILALLTDFGAQDPYVGVMKGVILARAPGARLVDLCHGVPPQDVRTAAFFLRQSVPYFAPGTVFVVVVDPGVGSARRVLWARTAKHSFLAPDNGVLSWVPDRFLELREVVGKNLRLSPPSATFHGRDVFAPAAAALCRGVPPSRLGPRIPSMSRRPFPQPRTKNGGARGEILCIDRFGNAVTNLARGGPQETRIFFKRRLLGRVRSHYAEAEEGASLALVGSSGFVELAVRNGNFAKRFKAEPGDPVESRNV